MPGVITLWLLYKRLAEFHSGIYEQLGSPTILFRQSRVSNSNVRRFIWTKGYRDLGDYLVNRYVRTLRVLTFILALLFLAGVANGVFGRA